MALCVFVIVMSSRWFYLLSVSFLIYVSVDVWCSYVEEDYNFNFNYVTDAFFIGSAMVILFYWIRT
jgi:hypothetical protein